MSTSPAGRRNSTLRALDSAALSRRLREELWTRKALACSPLHRRRRRMHGKHDPPTVAHHERQYVEFPRLELNTYLLAYMSSRAIIAVVPDLGYERDRSINQRRERLGSKTTTTLCNQSLGALKDTARPASSWSANCGGRHHLRRSYSSGSPIGLSLISLATGSASSPSGSR